MSKLKKQDDFVLPVILVVGLVFVFMVMGAITVNNSMEDRLVVQCMELGGTAAECDQLRN